MEYAEPDYVVQAVQVPDDVSFGNEWGLNNTGQSIGGSNGTPDADIDMAEAWDTATGNGSTVIALIDTGTQWDHPDLANNIWTNSGEIPGNGIDDDHNGYVDDVHGWDFYNDDNDPGDSNGHGTHTAGTLCAEGNNGEGVAGVLWHCRIMPLRFIGPHGGSTSDAVSAIEYAVAQGARVSSNSWGGGGFSLSLYNAVSAARAIGHVFVAAAGNNGVNTDSSPFYPAAFNLDNVLSVAATDYRDNLAGWSNYGVKTVDVGAPGVNIYSTYKGSGYAWLSGTSMAAPHVAGLVALVQEQHSGWDYPQVINQVLATVRPVASLDGKTKTGGVINALAALGGGTTPTVPSPPPASDTPPAAPSGLQATVDQTNGLVTLNWNDESDNETGFEIQREKYNSKRRKWAGTTLVTSVGADVTQATDSPGDGDFRYQVQGIQRCRFFGVDGLGGSERGNHRRRRWPVTQAMQRKEMPVRNKSV